MTPQPILHHLAWGFPSKFFSQTKPAAKPSPHTYMAHSSAWLTHQLRYCQRYIILACVSRKGRITKISMCWSSLGVTLCWWMKILWMSGVFVFIAARALISIHLSAQLCTQICSLNLHTLSLIWLGRDSR